MFCSIFILYWINVLTKSYFCIYQRLPKPGGLSLQEAMNDVSLQQAYKLLVTSHSICAQIIQVIEQTGNTSRQLLDFNHSVII